MPSFTYRITKYDPADRDEHGSYVGDEDTVSDHGPVETAYLKAVAAFAEATGIDRLDVREPQVTGPVSFGREPAVEGDGLAGLFPPDLEGFHDGATVPLSVALELVRAMLRDNGAWCRLEVEDVFTVHVGQDQYLYVGSDRPCEEALTRTRALGLFPERLPVSPYAAEFDEEPGEQRPADEDFWDLVRRRVTEGRAALLEERHVSNASRWHRLTGRDLDGVRARLAPRACVAVWPDLSTDVDAVLAALPEEGLVEFVREDGEDGRDGGGRITSAIADASEYGAAAAWLAGARAAAALRPYEDGDQPLLTAVLPDADGVLRARWRTEQAPGDRNWAFMKRLRRGQVVTGTVTHIASFGVTFVDIGGFTAMINLPELSRDHVDHPSDVVTVGQEVTAEILDVDTGRERVSLSLRALEDPARTRRRPGP
ncbi:MULTISPECIES: S1 RNA-binding domain-containing protein [unclassified Streptomyces]|uniref:S1 RNA-binding domain-containing protein n=1 Tax=unclassified Streptomyces TaxID=2593676 RepID=UPI0006ADD161|nr:MULTISPECIES: S1 RNA-binding domain-containing protein [unclassified Streptomyces]